MPSPSINHEDCSSIEDSHALTHAQNLEYLTISDTTSFTYWHAALSSCMSILDQSTMGSRLKLRIKDLHTANRSVWAYVSHLTQVVLNIVKALVAFLQRCSICDSGLDRKHGYWIQDVVVGLRVECWRSIEAVAHLTAVMEDRLRHRRARRAIMSRGGPI